MLDQLIQYSQANDRVCPLPDQWDALWQMLPGRHRVGAGWSPPLPLILGAWWHTSIEEKRARLTEHLRYAASMGLTEQVDRYLRTLQEQQWAHIRDFHA